MESILHILPSVPMTPLKQRSWTPYAVGIGIAVLGWLAFLLPEHPLGITAAFEHSAATLLELGGASPWPVTAGIVGLAALVGVVALVRVARRRVRQSRLIRAARPRTRVSFDPNAGLVAGRK